MRRRAGPSLLLLALCAVVVHASRADAGTGSGFVENRGQWPDAVRYSADLGSAVAYATDDGLRLDLVPWATALDVDLPGAGPGRITARGEQETRRHYFLGEPSRWRSDVRSFSELTYHDRVSGSDLRVRAGRDELLFEVIGPAGAESRPAWMRYAGLDDIRDAEDGGRRLEASGARVDEVPLSSDGRRWALRWRAADASAGERDDPNALVWSTYIGGAHNDYGQGVVLDSADNPVVTGYTTSGAFPTTPGAYDRTLGGSYDVFVAKMSPDGSTLLWATYIGSTLEDRAFDLALDANGNVVVVGHTLSATFPTTPGVLDRTLGGTRDAFVCKLSASGSALLWSTLIGGSLLERALMVRIDSAGCPVVTGETGSADFPLTANAFDASLGGAQDGYLLRLDPTAGTLLYATFIGGAGTEFANGFAFDAQERALVVGSTLSSDFPVTPGAYDVTLGGAGDAFVSLLDPVGGGLVASTLLGGSDLDAGYALLPDAQGRVHVTGSTISSDFPTTVFAYDRTFNGSDDVFYACLDASLASLSAGTYLGGASGDVPFALTLDASGYPILTGETYSSGYPTTANGYDRTRAGERDAFISQLDPVGPALLWSSFLGGSDYDAGWDLEPVGSGRVIVTGPTRSLDFPTTPGAFDRIYNGDLEDVFLTELDLSGSAGVEPTGPAVRSLVVAPNPFRDALTLSGRLDRTDDVGLTALDARGRVVATLLRTRLPAGEHRIVWDGTGRHGRPLPAGVYWLRWETSAGTRLSRVVRLR